MKKTGCLLLALCILFSQAACNSESELSLSPSESQEESAPTQESSVSSQTGSNPEESSEFTSEPPSSAPESTPPTSQADTGSQSSAGSNPQGGDVVTNTGIIELILDQTEFDTVPDRISGKIVNGTDEQIYLHFERDIQYYDGDRWVTIPMEYDLNDVQEVLPSAQECDYGFALYPDQHDYKAGRYRVVLTKMNLSAEFTIE